jgi:hypothetical protein
MSGRTGRATISNWKLHGKPRVTRVNETSRYLRRSFRIRIILLLWRTGGPSNRKDDLGTETTDDNLEVQGGGQRMQEREETRKIGAGGTNARHRVKD